MSEVPIEGAERVLWWQYKCVRRFYRLSLFKVCARIMREMRERVVDPKKLLFTVRHTS